MTGNILWILQRNDIWYYLTCYMAILLSRVWIPGRCIKYCIPRGKMIASFMFNFCPARHCSLLKYESIPWRGNQPSIWIFFFSITDLHKYSLLMHCIKIKSPAKSLLNEQYVFVGGNISFLCVLSCSSEEALSTWLWIKWLIKQNET